MEKDRLGPSSMEKNKIIGYLEQSFKVKINVYQNSCNRQVELELNRKKKKIAKTY